MRYNPHLDGLRAIAALLVLVYHVRVPHFTGGMVGVDVFFVLSGFLITSLLVSEIQSTGNVNIWRFYGRRGLRLYPPLLLMLLAVWAVCAAWPSLLVGFSPLHEIWPALLYMSDYTVALKGSPNYLIHTWTLAVEWKFYLLWPFVVYGVMKSRHPLGWLLGLYVLLVVWRMVTFDRLGWQQSYYRADVRMAGMVLGSALAFGSLQGRRWMVPLFLGTLAYASATFAWEAHQLPAWGWTAVEITSALAIAGAAGHSWLASRPLVWLGKMSYGIYLWHYPLVRIMRPDFAWWESLLIVAPASIALSYLSWLTIERIARRHKSSRPLPATASA